MDDFYHVYPIGDLREHNIENGLNCWCKPTQDGFVIIHNSMDGREDYETGKRRAN